MIWPARNEAVAGRCRSRYSTCCCSDNRSGHEWERHRNLDHGHHYHHQHDDEDSWYWRVAVVLHRHHRFRPYRFLQFLHYFIIYR